ncbi:MAG: DUF2851 family protein [Cyclobacteriaceae bacterium]|nr:DUF2851 family protein [Cyclobacteriaceae bacterium]
MTNIKLQPPNEAFLHFIWQHQYYDSFQLSTTAGEEVKVIRTGLLNSDSGPDFSEAKVRIGKVLWTGSIEIHLKASEWDSHNHRNDAAYNNVILHVVWEEDKSVLRKDGTSLPTIELKGRVKDSLLNKGTNLLKNISIVPCSNSLWNVPDIIKIQAIENSFFARLRWRATLALDRLKQLNHDWEQLACEMLFQNFGLKVNKEPFNILASSIPYKILYRHNDRIDQLEALLFGQAGLLNKSASEDYQRHLNREYKFLKRKYSLTQRVQRENWKFMRMRPPSFPTFRIAQLAGVLHKNKTLFRNLISIEGKKELIDIFDIKLSDYWHNHFLFGRKTSKQKKGIGKDMLNSLAINTVSVLQMAYGIYKDDQDKIDKMLQAMTEIPAENNAIIRMWKESGIKSINAVDTQGLIELFNNRCKVKMCLNCPIGKEIICNG